MANKPQKIRAFLPIFAEGMFSIDKPDDWDEMKQVEKELYFLNTCMRTANICCQCSNVIQTDFEVDLEGAETIDFTETN